MTEVLAGVRLTDEEFNAIWFAPLESGETEIFGVRNIAPRGEPDFDCVLILFTSRHIKDIRTIMLVIPINEYLRVTNNWLKGKQERSEIVGYDCGVGGGVYVEEYEVLDNFCYSYTDKTTRKCQTVNVEIPMVLVWKFGSDPEFEIG